MLSSFLVLRRSKLGSPALACFFLCAHRAGLSSSEPQLKCWFFREAQTPVHTPFCVYTFVSMFVISLPPLDYELHEGRDHASTAHYYHRHLG